MSWRPVIAVIGAGAVGGYYGGRLAQHGHDVHFLLRGDYDAVAKRGWAVRSCHGDFELPPGSTHIYRSASDMPKADLVVIAMKTTSNHLYQPLIQPLVKEDTAILTLQNGLGCEEQLAGLFGAERIFGGLCFVCINRIEPGLIHHMDYGLIKVGALLDSGRPRAQRIVELFRGSAIKCDLLESLRDGRWEKLVWNMPFNGLGAALDLSTDRLVDNEAGLALLRALMEEVVAAAKAAKVHLPEGIIDEKIRQTQTMGAYKSSMQIDREMGRPMEVEAILGNPVRFAESRGLKMPHLGMLYRLAQLVNLGKP